MQSVLTWLKRLASSKTIVVNVAALAALIFGSQEIQAFMTPQHAAEVLGVVNVILRFFTYLPLELKA